MAAPYLKIDVRVDISNPALASDDVADSRMACWLHAELMELQRKLSEAYPIHLLTFEMEMEPR